MTLKSWSIGLSGNNKSHSDLNYFNNSGDDTLSADDNRIETYTIDDIKHHEDIGISPEGLILVALLAGGDYHPVCKNFYKEVSKFLIEII